MFRRIHFSRSPVIKGLMKPLLIIKLEIVAQLRASFLWGAIIMSIDFFIFHRPPKVG